MGFWKSVGRKLGASDAEFWRQPGLFRLRYARDYGPKLLFALGIGLGVSSLLVALLLATAPAGQLGMALLMSGALILVSLLLCFFWSDLVEVTIALEETGIRRRTRALLFNPLGTRHGDEFWKYGSITRCGLASASELGTSDAILVLAQGSRLVALGIPSQLDLEEVTQALADRGLEPRRLKSLPPEARPGPSVTRRHLNLAAMAGGAGLLLAAAGGASRLWLHAGPGSIDPAAVEQQLARAPEGVVRRSFTGVGAGGLEQAQLSPDGHWVWGLDKTSRKHLVWNDTQDAPAGELDVPEAAHWLARFTPAGDRVVLAADRTLHVWQLSPLAAVGSWELKELPDHLIVTPDGRGVIAVAMTSVRQYELDSGRVTREQANLPPNALVDAALSPDGQSVRLAGQSHLVEVRLADGTVTELAAFTQPQRAYLFGALAAGGRVAAMQGNGGVELFHLDPLRQTRLPIGISFLPPAINKEGQLVAVPCQSGYGVWDVATGQPVARCPSRPASQVRLSAAGDRVLGWAPGSSPLVLWEISKPAGP